MKTEKFPAGKLIFTEGDLGDEAYRIISGSVEISIQDQGQKLVLAALGVGEIFGEMAMIEHRPRSATARVLETAELEVIDRGDFQQILAQGGEKLVPFLTTIFERLRVTNERLLGALDKLDELHPSRDRRQRELFGGRENAITVEVQADSEEMSQQGALQGRVIRQFPFQFGRRGEFAGADTPTINQLLMVDRAPYRVSRKHCILDESADGVFVEDRSSRLGTFVNGVRIGGGSLEHRARLRSGENSLVLGDPDSQVRFKLIVSVADTKVVA